MKLEDAIVVVKANLEEVYFKMFINYIEHVAENKMLTYGGEKLDVRNVSGYTLTNQTISDKVYFKHIQNIITRNYVFFKIKCPQINTKKLQQSDLLKYEINGKYEIHTDHDFLAPRTLTCIINLNEDYEGGDFVFYHQNGRDEMKRVKCEKGTIIFFPSTFLYPHKVEPITKGVRYSIVSWLI
jgi:predicted 2-oxoglutarate/Fe(II)-dependent dioxygenase YbiX